MPTQPSPETKLTGDDLIAEVLHNMEQGLFKIRYTTLVPYLYRIYLHPNDYDVVQPIAPYLITEIKRALDDRLKEWNNPNHLPAFLQKLGIGGTKQDVQYKRLSNDWVVEFHPDWESRLQAGEIEIYSELGQMPDRDFGVGSVTRRIRQSSVQAAAPPADAQEVEQTATRRSGQVDQPAAPVQTQDAPAAYAWLSYEDQSGPHRFAVTKDLTVIGRGGTAYWVDLRLLTLPDVSREHCRLRRDPQTGQFFLKDVSQFGTSLNGERIPPSVEMVEGTEKDRDVEVPVPPRARIGLADVLYLDFEASDAS